tara:strand:+ start:700 stop:912 length:213 start_codon:yes stop_codon:yes gene_type:complete
MCLGGGGGYQPPKQVMAPAPEPGPASPPDMVNNQVIDNANPRDEMEANQNAMDPKKTKLKVQSDKNPGMM